MNGKKVILGVMCSAVVVGVIYGVALWTGMLPRDGAALTRQEQLSYALGMNQAHGLRMYSIDVDADLYSRGLKDTLVGAKTLLTEEHARVMVAALESALREKQFAQQTEAARTRAEKNRSEGEAFLAKNKANEGVVARESGLQYKVLKAGDGRMPTIEDTVVVRYRGTLLDGTEIANSQMSNGPATLPVKKVMEGWREALQIMPVGSKWQLVIPPTLAYGERSVGPGVGPNSTLIFEVELLAIHGEPAESDGQKATVPGEKRRSASRRAAAAQ